MGLAAAGCIAAPGILRAAGAVKTSLYPSKRNSAFELPKGARLTAEEVGKLTELLPNRQVRITGTPDTQPLWDKPLCLALLVALFALEWVGRRLIKLA